MGMHVASLRLDPFMAKYAHDLNCFMSIIVGFEENTNGLLDEGDEFDDFRLILAS